MSFIDKITTALPTSLPSIDQVTSLIPTSTDELAALLPSSQGYLPKWLLFISVVSVFNSVQSYTNLSLTKEVYAGKPEEVTPLSARTFGTWTLISSIIRGVTAYYIHDPVVYGLCISSYCVALWHFGSEWLIYKTCKFDKGLAGPLIVATTSITWMLTQKDYYLGGADEAASYAAAVTSAVSAVTSTATSA